jgi:hypothetical protein
MQFSGEARVRTRALSMLLPLALASMLAHADAEHAAPVFHAVPLTATLRAGDAAGPVPAAAFEPVPDIAAHEQRLRALEASAGPYAADLAETTQALGTALQQLDQHEQALLAFGRSRQILRIHEGPFNLAQLPVIDAMIESNLALGRMQDADNLHATRFHLQLRALGEDNPAAASAYLDWADWNVQRYLETRNLDDSALQTRLISTRLDPAHQHYAAALALLQADPNASLEALTGAEQRIAGLSYIINEELQQDSHSALTRLGESSRNRSRQTPNQLLFREGTTALKRAISYSIEAPQPELAVARMLELGDWYLLMDDRNAALDTYEEALDLLAAAGLPKDAGEHLLRTGLPLRDPATSAFAAAPEVHQDFDGYIDVEFKVNRFGKAGNPEILASVGATREVEKALQKRIRGSLFRPAFADGTAVASSKVQLRYYYSL